jgi:hypothetical protein
MATDIRGLPFTTDSDAAADAFNAALQSFFTWRTDVMGGLNAALKADPDFALAHAIKGLMLFSLRQPTTNDAAAKNLSAARAAQNRCTAREKAYIAALDASLKGDLLGATGIYEQIAAEYPLDLLAIRFAQLELFWLGEAKWARDISERAQPAWSDAVPGFGTFLAVRSFGLEEAGQLEEAEQSGRQAIDIDPGDCWAAHSVAHVMEMQGRLSDGVAWLDGLQAHWDGANHIVHHLWWHRCLFEAERGNLDEALSVYDQYVRNPNSPLVQAMPDFYLDIQNCAALLMRLELRARDVGARWQDIADIAEARIGNHASPFTSAHAVITLMGAGRGDKARELLDRMRAFAAEEVGTLSQRYAAAAIPAAEAAINHRKGDHEAVVAGLMPHRRALWQMGGSHAQRDLFFQMIADSASRLERKDVLRLLLDDASAIGFAGLETRSSYADAARTLAGQI